MLLRSAGLPRVCLRCQSTVAQRAAASCRRYPAAHDTSGRRYASNSRPVIQSKERVEALISGDAEQNVGRKRDSYMKGIRGHKRPSRTSRTTDNVSHELLDEDPTYEEYAEAPESYPSLEKWSTVDRILSERPDVALGRSRKDDESPATFRHNLLDQQHLGVGALGRPADALIIKNPNRMTKHRRSVPMIEEDHAVTEANVDWHDLMPKDTDASADVFDEVRTNIDDLRPKDTTLLLRSDFDKLMGKLVDGFTRSQLATYYNRTCPDKAATSEARPSYPWIRKETQWMPSTPLQVEMLKPKQTLASMLIRERWDLEIQERIEGMGQKQLWIPASIFQPLFRNSATCLDAIKRDLLDVASGEDIARESRNTSLTISARRPTTAAILSRLDGVVQSLVSRKMPVGHVKAEDLQRPILRVLERITGTALDVEHRKKKASELVVHWIADKDQPHLSSGNRGHASDQRIEDPANIVLRLLDGQPRQIPCKETHVQMPAKSEKTTSGSFVEYHQGKRSMSWREKLRTWCRYVSRTGTPLQNKRPKPRHVASRLKLPLDHPLIPGDEADNRIAATFGHVLHTKLQIDESSLAKNRRLLYPIIPHPASLSLVTSKEQNVVQSTAIILNFIPQPYDKLTFQTQPPEVTIRLPVDSNTDLSNYSVPPQSTLHCVVPWYENDILITGGSVDIRFSQHRYLELDTTEIKTQQPSLSDFLAVSEFNLLEGRLKTPPLTSFNVPRKWLFIKPESTNTDENIELPYRFTGLEIHQTTDMQLQGHTLRYSSIEAGQHGGQRQELSVQAGLPGQQDRALTEKERRGFLELAEDIAMGKYFSWDEGYKSMRDPSTQKEIETALDVEQEDNAALDEDGETRASLPTETKTSRQDTTSALEQSILGFAISSTTAGVAPEKDQPDVPEPVTAKSPSPPPSEIEQAPIDPESTPDHTSPTNPSELPGSETKAIAQEEKNT